MNRIVWDNLATRYQDEDVRHFLEEASCIYLRFKKIIDDQAWERVEEVCIREYTKQLQLDQAVVKKEREPDSDGDSDQDLEVEMPSENKHNLSAPDLVCP